MNAFSSLSLFSLGFFYPWSVALDDFILFACGAMGIVGVLRGRKGDWLVLWKNFSWFWTALLLFLFWFAISVTWSNDISEALRRLQRKWPWVMLPGLALLMMQHRSLPGLFIKGLDFGMGTHLLLCFFQWTQIIPFDREIFWGLVALPKYSSVKDPTGLVDHLGFGLMYSMWGAILLHRWFLSRKTREIALAAVSIFFVYITLGRMGYILGAILPSVVIMAHAFRAQWKNARFVGALVVVMSLALFAMWISPATKSRINQLLTVVEAAIAGDYTKTDGRLVFWVVSLKVWQDHPIIGVGAGGYSKARDEKLQEIGLFSQKYRDNPYNIYLWHLVTGGLIGLASLLFFFFAWVRIGWSYLWKGGFCMFLGGLAIMIHGMANDSIEQHFPLFLAIFSIGTSMAIVSAKKIS